MEEPKEKIDTVLLTLSVTFTGEGQEPLVAQRVLVNGKEASVPLHVLLGLGDTPLAVFNLATSPAVRAAFAGVLLQSSQGLALSVLQEAQQAAKPAEGQGEVPPTDYS